MELYEIEGFLRGKCLLGDLLVGESNAQYLTRKLNEGAKAKAEVASLSQQVVILTAESAGLKELIEQHANCFAVCPNCSHEEPSETDDIVALYLSLETPATDAAIANIQAQGVDKLAARRRVAARFAEEEGDLKISAELSSEAWRAEMFAAELRKEAGK